MTTATKCEEHAEKQNNNEKNKEKKKKGRREKDAAQLGKNQRGQALEAVKREIYFEQAL